MFIQREISMSVFHFEHFPKGLSPYQREAKCEKCDCGVDADVYVNVCLLDSP